MTHITFTGVSSGSQYIVNVSAENIIGIGEESLINGKFASFTIKIKFYNYFYTVYIPILSSTSTLSKQMFSVLCSSFVASYSLTVLGSALPNDTTTGM